MIRTRWLTALGVLVVLGGEASAQGKLEIPTPSLPTTGVKTQTKFGGCEWHPVGVVEKVGDRTLVVKCEGRTKDGKADREVKAREIEVIDVLADGKVQGNASGLDAYLFSDVKKGDTVRLGAVFDHGDDKWYCVEICITRRPGKKLPQSQDPKEDERRYRMDSLLNDIENGEDVPEEEVNAVYPLFDPEKKVIDPKRGLPKKWRDMLNETRAELEEKKEQELKAKPPEKK